MKKLLLVALLFGLISGAKAEFPLSLGIKAGYNSSKFTLSNLSTLYNEGVQYNLSDVQTDLKAGFNIGVFARLQKDKFYLQPEAYVSVRRGNVRLSVDPETAISSNEVDYVSQDIELATLDIPLLFGYRLLNKDAFKLSVFTGPAASIVLNEKVNFTPRFIVDSEGAALDGISIGTTIPEDFKPEDEFRQANWNWQAGVGVDLSFLYVDVRYEWGLNDINTFDFEQKTDMLTFTLGIKLF